MHSTFSFLLITVSGLQISLMAAGGQPATVAPGQTLTIRVAGSSVSDSSGASLGNVEALSIDPQSGQVMFAMVSTGFPKDRTRVTPIPWQLIQHRTDARAVGGIPGTFQQLTVPFSQQVLRSAPQIDSQTMARVADTSWMATSRSYFAAFNAAGGVSATTGTQTGAANAIANPNASGSVLSATNDSARTNFFAQTNAPVGFTNQSIPQAGTNALLPGTVPTSPTLPVGALPPGTIPAGQLPPGTIPADALPPGTVPSQGGAFSPANPAPPRVPLTPARPSAPAK